MANLMQSLPFPSINSKRSDTLKWQEKQMLTVTDDDSAHYGTIINPLVDGGNIMYRNLVNITTTQVSSRCYLIRAIHKHIVLPARHFQSPH